MCNELDFDPIDPTAALVLMIVNIFAPGLGTIIYGCLAKRTGRNVVLGLLQGFLSLFFIGWIWAIIHGYKAYKVSLNAQLTNKGDQYSKAPV